MLQKPKIFIKNEIIIAKVKLLGKMITNDFLNKNLTLICIMKGCIIFTADLIRNINIPCRIEILHASSYINKESTGNVKIFFNPISKDNISNKNILIIDDILDTGRTLDKVITYINNTFNPIDIKTCVLLDKPSRRIKKIKANYVGFEIPDIFAVGYGLDYNEYYRNLPYIGIINDNLE